MPIQKIVGQPCTECGTPYTMGPKGAYCKPCYIKWKNNTEAQATAKNVPFVTPGEIRKEKEQDAEGKCRFHFALKAYELGLPLDVSTATTINSWVNYSMTGKLGQ